MNEIKAFKTTDGTIFESEKEAKEHQAELSITYELHLLINKNGFNRADEDILEFILANKVKLLHILAEELHKGVLTV